MTQPNWPNTLGATLGPLVFIELVQTYLAVALAPGGFRLSPRHRGLKEHRKEDDAIEIYL